MRSRLRGERGSVTAEFAAVVPAVILVLACCLAAMQLASQQLRLQDAAAGAARMVARGESYAAATRQVAQLVPGAQLSRESRGAMLCVQASVSGSIVGGLMGAITVTARSCALAGGT